MDKQEIFPDGTVIDKWFYDINIPELSDLGKQYVLTDNNVLDDGKIHTKEIQMCIRDRNYDSGGAGIITTVDDYAKFAAALANSGTGLNNNRILSSATVKLMKTNQLNEAQRKTMNWRRLRGYGYGLGVRTLIDKAESGSNLSLIHIYLRAATNAYG